MQRILIIHNKYRIPGGEDVCASAQTELLRAKGHEVRVFEKDNKVIDSYGLLRKAGLFFDTSNNATVANEVAALAKEFKPDAALIHNTLPLISPSVYAPLKRANVKVLQWIHNYRLVCPAGTLHRDGKSCTLCLDGGLEHAAKYNCWTGSKFATLAVTRMLDRHRRAGTWQKQVDCFVALNSYMREVLIRKNIAPAEKIVVQPNFVSVPTLPAEGPGEGFVFLGRLTPEKGIRTLLDAQKIAKVPLKVIGQNPDDWRSFAGDGVEFLGRVPREEALAIVAKSRALVFPSEWPEGCPGVIQEAMALGRPVIASRVAGAVELVRENETGLFFETGNVQQLADKLRELQANPLQSETMGRAARERYESEYDPETGYERITALLQK